jgi:hypothetical protein
MKIVLFLLIPLFMFNNLMAQSCLPQGISFITQAQIDNFHINYPNCTQIEGSVIITSEHNITNLLGLNGLSSIGGSLVIYSNLDLSNLSGLDSLTTIGGDLIIGLYGTNPSLSSLTGLDNLTIIGGKFELSYYNKLTSLTGLDNLTAIGSELVIQNTAHLINLTGLNNVTTIDGYIFIYGNSALTSLTGIDNIDKGTITDLGIYSNASLSTCEVKSICEYLANPNGMIYIHENNAGCNSQQEVEDACATNGVESLIPESSMSIYPNPACDNITIKSPTKGHLSILNLNGQELLQQEITETIITFDISTLPAGVYLVKRIINNAIEFGKLIKE